MTNNRQFSAKPKAEPEALQELPDDQMIPLTSPNSSTGLAPVAATSTASPNCNFPSASTQKTAKREMIRKQTGIRIEHENQA